MINQNSINKKRIPNINKAKYFLKINLIKERKQLFNQKNKKLKIMK